MSDMADDFGAAFVNLEEYSFPPELLAKVPAILAHTYQVVPLCVHPDHCLSIAISDPSDLDDLDYLHQALRGDYEYFELQIAVADAAQLREFVNKLYPRPRQSGA